MGDRRPFPIIVITLAEDPAEHAITDALLGLPVLVVDGASSSLPVPAALGGAVLTGPPGAAAPPRLAAWARRALHAGLPLLGAGAGAPLVSSALDGLRPGQPVALVADPGSETGRASLARFARELAAARHGRLPARRCGTESRRRDIYQEALDLLSRYDGTLRLDQVAAELYVSRRQLQRIFAEAGATTFSEARRRVA